MVLASGTLSPIASLTRQLFPTLAPSAITHFACGHVVPKDRLLAIALPQARLCTLPPPPHPPTFCPPPPIRAHKAACCHVARTLLARCVLADQARVTSESCE